MNEVCVGVCQKTGKYVLMEFDENKNHWMCLHRDDRKEELKEIKEFTEKYK